MKKAAFAEFLQLIIMIVGLVATFFLVMLISIVAGQNMSVEITDSQRIDLAGTYVSLLGIINREQYDALSDIAEKIREEENTQFFFGDIQTFRTIERVMVGEETVSRNVALYLVFLPDQNRRFAGIAPTVLLDRQEDCQQCFTRCTQGYGINCECMAACNAQSWFIASLG